MEERLSYLPPEALERNRNQIVISALEGLCTYLGTVRDGRKSVLYVSGGMASTLPPGVATSGSLTPQGVTPSDQMFFNSMDLQDQLKNVFEAAARSNTSIYSYDPRGLSGSAFDLSDNVSSDAGRQVLSEMNDILRTVASQTDGRAFVNRNDAGPAFDQMLRDSAAYYLLGYTSTEAPRDGKFHEIDVKVQRKGVDVRARRGYWAYTEEDAARAARAAEPKATAPSDVGDALAAMPHTARGRLFDLWGGAAIAPSGKPVLTVSWESLVETGMADAPASPIDHVIVTATSIYGDEVFKGPVPVNDQTGRRAGAVSFEVSAGGVHLVGVAESASGRRLDTQEQNVDTPDPAATGLRLTEPIVFRGRTARDIQQIRSAEVPVPTASREFSRTERLLIRFQILGVSGPPPVPAVALLNQFGKTMVALPPPACGAGGTCEINMGLGSLPPGQYLIAIEPPGPPSARKLVAFAITG